MNQNFGHISPYIRVAMDNRIKAPWSLQERVIFDYELLLIKEGIIRVTIDHKVYIGKPGDMFLFRPKESHSITILEGEVFRQPHLHFDLNECPSSPLVKVCFKPLCQLTADEKALFRHDILSQLNFPFPSHFRPEHLEEIEAILYKIIEVHTLHPPYYQLTSKGLFIQLWAVLLNELKLITHPTIRKNTSLVTEVRDYIVMNMDKPITLDLLAEKFLMSKYHLAHCFKDIYHIGPIHYHQQLRLTKAKELIQYSTLSISEIGVKLGYTSIHSFSRAFKSLEGVSPSYYRQYDF